MSFLHFKDRRENPSSIEANWWDKLNPIISLLYQKSAFYWTSSTNLTVDKVMIKFEGWTSQKVTIPGKPISTGFKIFALPDFSYIFNWECTEPGLNKGLLEAKKCVSVSILNSSKTTLLSPTQSVVIRLNLVFIFIYWAKKAEFSSIFG